MPLLIVLFAMSKFGEGFSQKIASGAMSGESKVSYGFYYVTHSLIACIFFVISGGFSISVNLPTFIYSVMLGGSILINMLVSMLILRCMNILGSGVLSTPIQLSLIAVASNLIFGEEITSSTLMKIIVTSFSAVLIFIDIRITEKKAKGEKESAKRYVDLKKYIPLLLISVTLGAFQTLLLKSFVISESVTNEHSFYFLTNVMMLSWGVIMLLAGTLKGRKNLKEGLSFFKPKRIFSAASNVVCANVGTLLQVPILTMINVSVFSPLSSALGIVLSVVISLIFKEKLGIFSYIGAAVAVLAIFV